MTHDPNPEAAGSSPARLEALAGPLEGKTFPLTEAELSVGREPSNQISLLDSLVSRRHCVIRREGQGFLIKDLDSRNSTFVNNVPVKERLLADGDQIRIGKSILVFQGLQQERTGDGASVRLDSAPTPSGATMVLRKQDAIYLQPARLHALDATERTVRDLNVLLNFSKSLNSVHGLAALQEKVLEAVLEISPADRAALLLTEEGTEEFTSIMGRDRKLGANQPIQVSQTIVKRVIKEHLAVLCNDVAGDEMFREAESLLELRDGAARVACFRQDSSEVVTRLGGPLDTGQQAERHREAQQQAPACADRAPPDRPSSQPRLRSRGQRTLQSEDANHGQQHQHGQKLHLVTEACGEEKAHGQCAKPRQQRRRRDQPAQDGARLRRASAPSERCG